MPSSPSWPPKSAPRLFVGDTINLNAIITLDGTQAHYLGKVMRVRAGDAVILCDNVTGEWAARVDTVDKRRIEMTVVDHLRTREAVPDIWLCPALLKKDRFDLVLEKATELGVARIQPIITRRCVADKLNIDRATTITTEAAEQCARTALPQVGAPTSLDTFLNDWPETRILFFADEESSDLGDGSPAQPASIAFGHHTGPAAIVIGPEGGFDKAERAAIRAHPNARSISLGPRILRGETAAIAALSVWMGQAGDWGDTASKQE
ncbi:MAG: 16S rRNA (uracil(1498)-N(3))-methyltransferase [Erythrobacter sp.]